MVYEELSLYLHGAEDLAAIALRDESLWKGVIAELPAHLDSDGLVKYFPTCLVGSDTLTAYMLSVSNEAGWAIQRLKGGMLCPDSSRAW